MCEFNVNLPNAEPSTPWKNLIGLQAFAKSISYDGDRFANALVSLNVSPSEMTWKRGVDVLSFGATKNGAMCAEAVIFFNPSYAKDFDYKHKMAWQLMSKGRFFACQFLAYLENDLWLRNATHANQMAQSLRALFQKIIFP